jgi:NitT/TauT family transport system substrate-binding protein
MPIVQSRRNLLTKLGIAGAAGFGTFGRIGLGPTGASRATEPPLETTTIRLSKPPSICLAPQFVVQELLAAESFERVQYVPNQSHRRSLPMAPIGISSTMSGAS